MYLDVCSSFVVVAVHGYKNCLTTFNLNNGFGIRFLANTLQNCGYVKK